MTDELAKDIAVEDAPRETVPSEGFDSSAFESAAARTRRGAAHDAGNYGIPTISSQEEAEKLRPGQQFKGPDGSLRSVPYKVMAPEDLNNVPDGADFVGPDGELRVKPKYQSVDFTAQYLYNVAHSDKGRRKALERSYPGKVRDDPSGGFYIEDEDGVLRKPGRGAAATGGGLASAAAPTALSIGGAVGGGVFGGLPGIAGAAAGGAAGSKVNDIVSSLAGVYDDEGSWRDAAIEGGLAAGGQVIGHAAGTVAPAAVKAYQSGKKVLPTIVNSMLGTNPEKLTFARQLAERGATPGKGKFSFDKAGTEVPPSQLFPESPALQNIVEFKEPALHTQDPLRQSREAHYERSIGEILEGVGVGKPMSRTEIDRTFKELVAAQEAGNTPLVEKLEKTLTEANTRSAIHPGAAVPIEEAGARILESIRAKSAASDQRLKELLELRKADATRRASIAGETQAARTAELRAAQEAAQRDAQALIDQGFADLDRQSADALRIARAGHNTGDLHRTIAEDLNSYRTGIQGRAEIMYDTADELSGATFNRDTGQWVGGAVIDTNRLSRQADAFLRELPDGFEANHPVIVRRLRELAGEYDQAAGEWIREPAVTTWSQLRDLRTQLRQNIKWNDLTSDVKNGTYKFFNNRVNEIVMDAANPETREAAAALRRADDFYRENMGPLGNKQIQNLMDGIRSGLQVDPKILLDQIMKEGRTEVAQQIERIVGPEAWNALRAADTQEMMQVSRDIMGNIDGKKFAREVLKRQNQGLLETLHGPSGSQRIVQQAQRIEQLAGRVPIRAQPGDTNADIIMRARAAVEAAQEAAQDPIKALNKEIGGIIKQHKAEVEAAQAADPDFTKLRLALDPTVGAHAAIDRILSHPDMLVAASRAFPGGENSPEFQLIRQVYAQRFLQRSRVNLRPSKQLEEMTPKLQSLMFPGVTLKQMQLFAKEMELLVPKGGDGGKGIMKTNIQENPLGAASGLGKLAGPAKLIPGANMGARKLLGDYYAFVRHIATSPTTLRWLEKGLTSADPAGRAEARAALRQIARQAGAAGAGTGAGLGAQGPGASENE
jgi:hypothetical protein